MKKHRLQQFVGLPGIKNGRARGVFFSSRTGCLEAMRKHRATSAAGDHGAIMVWRKDDGEIRADFQVFLSTRESQTFKTRGELGRWLDRWIPAMHGLPIGNEKEKR